MARHFWWTFSSSTISTDRKHRRSLTRALPRLALPLLAVCLPWYGLCYLRNGPAFLVDFFVKHHFDRFASDALQHREPWWFYLPVVAGALLPWTPLIFAAVRRSFYRDPRRLFLLLVVLWGLLLFSASVNKLPGYVLPLVPACAILMALGVEEPVRAKENSPGREPWETRPPPDEPRNGAEEIRSEEHTSELQSLRHLV